MVNRSKVAANVSTCINRFEVFPLNRGCPLLLQLHTLSLYTYPIQIESPAFDELNDFPWSTQGLLDTLRMSSRSCSFPPELTQIFAVPVLLIQHGEKSALDPSVPHCLCRVAGFLGYNVCAGCVRNEAAGGVARCHFHCLCECTTEPAMRMVIVEI